MRYASVCSGIEAATVAWHPLGWTPVWFSQYDPEWDYNKGPDFASKVLAHRFPDVPNLGDMTKLREHKTYQNEYFDLLVGGTPCQAFSIAGLRAGLRDERSNLALEFVRILMDKQPTWFVWENVPGVLTSGEGSDFGCILSAWTGQDIEQQKFTRGGIIEAADDEHYSIAWRILDSQYFGVPQRRRRVFVIGHSGKDWRPPVAVLFERESLCRDFTPGRKTGKGATTDTAGGSNGNSERGGYRQRGFGDYVGDQTASALKKRDHKDATDLVLLENISDEKTAPCMTKQLAEQSGQDLGQPGMLVVAKAEDAPIVIDRAAFNQGANAKYDMVIEETQICPPPYSERAERSVSIDCRNNVVNNELSATIQSKNAGGHSLNYINPVMIIKGGGILNTRKHDRQKR